MIENTAKGVEINWGSWDFLLLDISSPEHSNFALIPSSILNDIAWNYEHPRGRKQALQSAGSSDPMPRIDEVFRPHPIDEPKSSLSQSDEEGAEYSHVCAFFLRPK